MTTIATISLRDDVAAWEAEPLHVITDANAQTIAWMIARDFDDYQHRDNGMVGLVLLAREGRVVYRHQMLRDLENLEGIFGWSQALGALSEWIECHD